MEAFRACLLTGLVLLIGLLETPSAKGQSLPVMPAEPYESDILNARPVRYYLGLGLGAYAFQHAGPFSPNCDCFFDGASGTGFAAAPEFIVHYPKAGFAFKAMIMYRNLSATFTQAYPQRPTVLVGGDSALVDFERWSDVTMTYIDVLPSVSWYMPRTPVFVAAGLAFSFPIKTRYNNNERVLSDGFAYASGGRETVLLNETTIPGSTGLRIDLHLSAGIDIYLADHFYLTPQGGAILPLGPVSSNDPRWHVYTEYAMLIMKYRF
jgi:hypothetical protein